MEEQDQASDRAYYAQRAAEELKLAEEATDKDASSAHRRLQRAYLERASVGNRPNELPDEIG